MSSPWFARGTVLLLVAAMLGPTVAAELLPGQASAPRPIHAMGQRYDVEGLSRYLAGAGVIDAAEPLPVGEEQTPWFVLESSWRELAGGEGSPAFDAVAQVIETANQADLPLVLALEINHGSHDLTSQEGQDQLRRFLRELTRAVGPSVDWYLLEGVVRGGGSPEASTQAAFEIKLASNVIRAEDPGAAVALTIRGADQRDGLEAAYRAAGDLEPYIEAVNVSQDGGATPTLVERTRQMLLEWNPGATLWAHSTLPEESSGAGFGGELLARGVSLVAASADLVVFPAGDPQTARKSAQAIAALRNHLPADLTVSPSTGAGVRVESRQLVPAWQRFFDEKNFREVIVYWSPDPRAAEAETEIIFKKVLRRGYRVLDPLSGQMRYARTADVGQDEVRVTVPLGRAPRLILVTRQKFSPGFDLELEQAEVTGEHRLTADEIIAAHQRWQEYQDDRLISISRQSEFSLRFRYALVTGTADLTLRGDSYWDRQTGQDWVIREKFFNGVRVKWDKLPELPFIDQEAAVQVPLRLDLDKRYRYERDGEEVVEGRTCWRLRFEPTVKDISLYRGEVWIDQATGAMVKMHTLQSKLDPPLISDEQTQIFRPYPGPDGQEFWLPDGGEGQQIYTVQGSNLVILRKITFGPPQINQPGFYQAREGAYASDLQMLRKTEEGFKWLTKSEDGTREVLLEGDSDQWFAVGGVFKDESADTVLPLAGVNYTDIDFLDRGLIANVFFAGVFANLSLSDPSFLDSKLDLGAVASLSAIKRTEKDFDLGIENEGHRVRRLNQDFSLTAGYPLGEFLKLRGVLALEYNTYSDDDETVEDFLLPADHLETSAALELAYDRKGWGVLGRYRTAKRSDWDSWGPEEDRISAEDAKTFEQFSTWSVGFQKSFFMPFFQKIEISAETMGGQDLDRFSAFDFGFFSGNRIRGFSGSGIRFDKGTTAQLQYSFNLQEVVRFDAVLDHGRVHDPRLGKEMSSHTGVGLAANFIGPWQTLVRLDVGYALKSDLEPVEGDIEYLLVVLRLF